GCTDPWASPSSIGVPTTTVPAETPSCWSARSRPEVSGPNGPLEPVAQGPTVATEAVGPVDHEVGPHRENDRREPLVRVDPEPASTAPRVDRLELGLQGQQPVGDRRQGSIEGELHTVRRSTVV